MAGTGAASTSATQITGDRCRLSSGSANNAELYFNMGVAGGVTSPEFQTGYANRTSMEFDVKDVSDLTASYGLGFHPEGVIAGTAFSRLIFQTGYVTTNTYRKRMTWTDVDNTVQTADIVTNSAVTKAYYQHVYRVEFYDYLQQTGSDSVSRATFQWKVLEDGVTILESHDGASQVYSRFGAVSGGWCSEPRGRISVSGFISFGADYVDFDDLKLNVNADESCVP